MIKLRTALNRVCKTVQAAHMVFTLLRLQKRISRQTVINFSSSHFRICDHSSDSLCCFRLGHQAERRLVFDVCEA